MRVALLSHANPFRYSVCRGILDSEVQLVSVMERRDSQRGLWSIRRVVGNFFRRVWPGALSKLRNDPLYAHLADRKIDFISLPAVRHPLFAQKLASLDLDLIVLSRFSEIIPTEVINIPRLGIVNIHCSLLPQLRGPDPIAGAIIGGLKESGITFHFVDEGIDTGDIIHQRSFPIEPDENGHSFCEQAARLMTTMTCEVMGMFLKGDVPRQKQDHSLASYYNVGKNFGTHSPTIYMDWNKPARLIDAVIRSGAVCLTLYRGNTLRLMNAQPGPDEINGGDTPGQVLARRAGWLVVATEDKPLEIEVVPFQNRTWWSIHHDGNSKFRRGARWFRQLNKGELLQSRPWPANATSLS